MLECDCYGNAKTWQITIKNSFKRFYSSHFCYRMTWVAFLAPFFFSDFFLRFLAPISWLRFISPFFGSAFFLRFLTLSFISVFWLTFFSHFVSCGRYSTNSVRFTPSSTKTLKNGSFSVLRSLLIKIWCTNHPDWCNETLDGFELKLFNEIIAYWLNLIPL